MTLTRRCAAQLIDSLVCAATGRGSAGAPGGVARDEAYCAVESLAAMPSELRQQLLLALQQHWERRVQQLKERDSAWWHLCATPSDLERRLWTVLTPRDDLHELRVIAFPPWFIAREMRTEGNAQLQPRSLDCTGAEWFERPADLCTSLFRLDLTELRSLVLHNQDAVTDDALASVLAAVPSLEALDVSYCRQLSDAGVDHALLETHVTLTALSCSGVRALTTNGIRALARCKALRSLALGGCLGVTRLPMLEAHVRLAHINLQGLSSLNDWDVRSFLAPHWDSLQVLKLCETEFTTASLVQLMAQLSLPRAALRELDLSWCSHCEDAALGSVFQYTPALTTLKLRCLNIPDCVLRGVGGSACCASLRVLDLERCSLLSDDGFEALVEHGAPGRLEMVNLSWTAISSPLVRRLLLKNAATLTHVRLQGCRYVDHSVLRVFAASSDVSEVSATRRWPCLERVDCKWVNEIRDDQLIEASQFMRRVTFVGYYGTEFTFHSAPGVERGASRVREICT